MENKVLDPTKVKVLISTRWSGTGYKSSTIRRVESYNIETAIDSDADPWTIVLGNPSGDLNAILARDNEVRVQIYGAGERKTYLLTGIMDDATFDQNGSVTITGRDMSSIATDSDHFPNMLRGISARDLIQKEAAEIGVTRKFKMDKTGGAKTWFTDGSEKYWEFWYRMIRKEKQWMWLEPDGTLVSGELNYAASPKYRLAEADIASSTEIPVESFSFRKTTQGRIGKLAVAWRSQKSTKAGTTPNIEIYEDKTTADWIKRPQRIIEDKHAVSVATAKKVADEEIQESKVGAIEIVVNIPDPGYLLEVNNMCRLRLPTYGISGEWFIVGVGIQGDASGFMQSIRLREKGFAVSSRVPQDPEWEKPDDSKEDTQSAYPIPQGCVAKNIGQTALNNGWWDCFQSAAFNYHDSFDYKLYLAVLLAIAQHETGITNVRSHTISPLSGGRNAPVPHDSNEQWSDIRTTNPTPAELQEWKEKFANDPGSYGIPNGWAAAVGPMQLFTPGFKEQADQMRGGRVDEFFGNRWNPCDNIMEAAKVLHDKIPYQSGKEEDLWKGVDAYGYPGFGEWIKNAVKGPHPTGTPASGWLECVKDTLSIPAQEENPSGKVPDPGAAASFAKQLQLYNKEGLFKDDNGQIMKQIDKVAKEQNLNGPCGNTVIPDAHPLAACCYLIENGFSIGLYAYCEDHDCLTDSGNRSRHSDGLAVDVDSIGIPSVGHYFIGSSYNATLKGLVIKAMNLMIDGGWLLPDQLICAGIGYREDADIMNHQLDNSKPRGGNWAGDHTNHIHIGY